MVSHCSKFPIKKMAQIFSLPKSSYYSKRNRSLLVTDRDKKNIEVSNKIREVYTIFKGRYGSPKITLELRRQGFTINHKKVEKVMKEHDLYSITKRKFKVTPNSKNTIKAAPDLVQREFTPKAPNKVWVSDITYIQTKSGWAYLCVFIDLFSRSIVGWSVDKNMKVEMVERALNNAIKTRKPKEGLMLIFPSWLEHKVTQNLSEEKDPDRIVVSFNISQIKK